MDSKVGRNDPCPCGSGKKYKQCCMKHPQATGKKTFKAKLLSGGVKKAPDLMERAFGDVVAQLDQTPPVPPVSEEKE
jgi:uncharacterized protein